MTVNPPVWTLADLEAERQISLQRFRDERIKEPLEQYLDAFDQYRAGMENLLEKTVDLSQLAELAAEVLSDADMLLAVRYLSGPPISKDDLVLLSEATLSPTRLRADPEMARRVIDVVLAGLDRNRFPWLSEAREPTAEERGAAAMASAAMIASRRVMTDRANESNVAQEEGIGQALTRAGLTQVGPRSIDTLDSAPARGEWCSESIFAGRKADLVVRPWDGRVMPMEAKVSNSYLNSIKRLNNDAAVKAGHWIREFGRRQTVPAAVLAGTYKLTSLESAQNAGLTIFWSHRLRPMLDFIEATR